MTVTYTLEVSRARFWGFPKLLARWKGSIYRLIYREMTFFLFCFYSIMFVYRVVLGPVQMKWFETLSVYCREFTSLVPITFVLGFYVTFVVGRWWQQYINIPWPDRIAMQVSSYVHGHDERGRLIRRSLVRYCNLMALLTFQNTSTVVKRRFPTTEHLVEAGLLTEEEKKELDRTPTPHGVWWVPAHWFCQLAAIARKESRIHDDLHLKSLIDDCMDLRGQCGMVWSYDWISVPLVYTQVVTIAVYSFFAASVFGRQFLYNEPESSNVGHVIDRFVPIFSVFQFFFYVGWLKVAESMICPFGEDDDDFDMNWIIDRNMQVSLLIVDCLHRRVPRLEKDLFWDNDIAEIPYTQGAAKFKAEPFFGSTTAMDLTGDAVDWEQMPPIREEDVVVTATASEEEEDDDDDDDERLSAGDGEERDCESIESSRVGKRKLRGLGGLLQGFSRQNLASRVGSRKSLSDQRSSSSIKPPGSPRQRPNAIRTYSENEQNYNLINGSSDKSGPLFGSPKSSQAMMTPDMPSLTEEVPTDAERVERVRRPQRRRTIGETLSRDMTDTTLTGITDSSSTVPLTAH